jgi:hypothetical protein
VRPKVNHGKRVLAGKHGKIEALGWGQQFASHGKHFSGAELLWQPQPPEKTPRADLPAITEEQIARFFEKVAPIIEADANKARKPDGPPTGTSAKSADTFDVIAALHAIPNDGAADWEFWTNIGMACFAATGGDDFGFLAWCAWSAKNPCHDNEACLARWQHYPSSPPNQTGAGKLFKLAREACLGLERPSKITQRKDDVETCTIEGPEHINVQWWLTREIEPPIQLLGKLITNVTRMILGGDTGIGKTQIAMAMASSIATGRQFLHWKPAHPSVVLYVDGEMPRGMILQRIQAIMDRNRREDHQQLLEAVSER